jgi:hypothetical protein
MAAEMLEYNRGGAALDCAVFILAIALRYILYFSLSLAFLAAVAVATGYRVGGLIGGLLPTMFGSLMCGVAYARRSGRKAPSEVAWGAATLFTVVNLAGGSALFVLLATDEVAGRLSELSRTSPMGLFLFALIALLTTIVASRVFFGLGSRSWHGPVRA